MKFKVGDHVYYQLYKGVSSKFYGVIVKDHGDGIYDVRYSERDQKGNLEVWIDTDNEDRLYKLTKLEVVLK